VEEHKDINIAGIGLVKFIKSTRAKRLSIRFKYSDELIVTIPHRLHYQTAEDIVRSKADWIIKKLSKAPSLSKLRTVFDVASNFETKNHRLAIIPDHIDTTKVKIYDGIIKVRYPIDSDIRDQKVQKAIRTGIEKALKLEAQEWIPFRIKKFSLEHGFKYKDIRFKNARTRWGSCSHDNNLNFNIQLMMLPGYLIDYVILHELCHTIEKNHSRRFWSLMDRILGFENGESKKLDGELKKYRIGGW
jgi:hypothetical protein